MTRSILPTATLTFLAAALLLAACKGDADNPGAANNRPASGGEFVPGQEEKKAPAAEASAASFRGPGEHLIKNGELAGYTLSEGPDYYVKDKLYEIIDGASDGYIGYGFVEMGKATYKVDPSKKLEEEINVEIYQFETNLGAMGKFSEERSNCIKADTLPRNLCLRSSDVLAWKGNHLLKVQTFDDSPAAEAAITEVVQHVEKTLGGEATVPKVFERFPAAARLQGSEGYRPRDSFGFTGLKEIFTALYQPPGDAYKEEANAVMLFAVEKGSADEARQLFDAVRATVEKDPGLKDNGGIRTFTGVGEVAFAYKDAVGTHTFALKGQTLLGGRDFKDDKTAEELTKALAGGL